MRTAHAIALDALAGLLAKRPLGSGATGDLFEMEVDAVEGDKGRPLDVALIPLNQTGCGVDINGHKSGGHSVPCLIEQVENDDCGGADQRDSAKADEREVEEGHGSGACRYSRCRPLGTPQQCPKRLSQGITRVFGFAAGEIADRCLATAALRRDLRLAESEGNQPCDG